PACAAVWCGFHSVSGGWPRAAWPVSPRKTALGRGWLRVSPRAVRQATDSQVFEHRLAPKHSFELLKEFQRPIDWPNSLVTVALAARHPPRARWLNPLYPRKPLMKQHLLALAVLSAAGAAHAQSNVTLYGVADAAIERV